MWIGAGQWCCNCRSACEKGAEVSADGRLRPVAATQRVGTVRLRPVEMAQRKNVIRCPSTILPRKSGRIWLCIRIAQFSRLRIRSSHRTIGSGHERTVKHDPAAALFELKWNGRHLEGRVGALELVALLHPLGAAVLRVAAVLERPPLLLQPDHFLAGASVELLVQLADRQRNELLIVQQVVAPAAAAHRLLAVHHSAGIGPQADHHAAAAGSAHLGTGLGSCAAARRAASHSASRSLGENEIF